jgi:hypothetical protein
MLPITAQKASILESKLFQIRNTHVIRAIRRKALEQIEAKTTPMSKK